MFFLFVFFLSWNRYWVSERLSCRTLFKNSILNSASLVFSQWQKTETKTWDVNLVIGGIKSKNLTLFFLFIFFNSINGKSSLTFPLGAVVDLSLLAVLQVRTGQGVGGGRGAQQLLRAAAVQAVVTAVRGAHALGRGLHAPTVASERAGRGAGPLTDGAAWHHGEILPEKTTTKRI